LTEILYLRYIISSKGVQVDQQKFEAILDWPPPTNLTQLKAFFVLCSYYRSFAKGFSQLSAPMTNLTKKGDFIWIEEAQKKFDKLKEVMSSCHVLATLDFFYLL